MAQSLRTFPGKWPPNTFREAESVSELDDAEAVGGGEARRGGAVRVEVEEELAEGEARNTGELDYSRRGLHKILYV